MECILSCADDFHDIGMGCFGSGSHLKADGKQGFRQLQWMIACGRSGGLRWALREPNAGEHLCTHRSYRYVSYTHIHTCICSGGKVLGELSYFLSLDPLVLRTFAPVIPSSADTGRVPARVRTQVYVQLRKSNGGKPAFDVNLA